MNFLPHWIRDDNGQREFYEVPDKPTIEELDQRVSNIQIVIPYFQQAAQSVVFAKENTANYPNTMTALRTQDNNLIASNSYDGLTEGDKAQLLITATKNALGI
ncbi:MAG: hypothetical protein AAFN81_33830 [Bacteroidota bacterium]